MNGVERICYDAETGVFTWAVAGRGIRKGAVAGSSTHDGYLAVKVGFKAYRAHRLAWFMSYGVWPEGEVDHINGIKTDNRLCNLRVVDRSGNMQNQRVAHRDNKSCGLLGVTWNKQHRRWQSKLMVRQKAYHVGYFETPEAAHAAYVEMKRKLSPQCSI